MGASLLALAKSIYYVNNYFQISHGSIAYIFVTKFLKNNLRTENNIQNFNTVRYSKHSMRHFGPNLRSRLPKEIRKTKIAELVTNSNSQNCYLCHS